MMHWDGYGWNMGFGFGGVFMLLFWTLLAIGVIYSVRRFSAKGSFSERDDSALEILKKRYAKGELSKEEFEEKRRHIE